MAKKLDLEKIRKESAELQAERANVEARIAELDQRLSDESASLAELRTAADELAEKRRYLQALDQRLAGLTEQRREAEAEAQNARLAVLHKAERELYERYLGALRELQDGLQAEYLAARLAVTDAGGWSKTSPRQVAKAIAGLLKWEGMMANRGRGPGKDLGG